MTKRILVFALIIIIFCEFMYAHNLEGTYKLAGDSRSSGQLMLTKIGTDSTYSFKLTKSAPDCETKTISGKVTFDNNGIALFSSDSIDSCILTFKLNHDIISIMVNCNNNLDYLCSFSGRYILNKNQ